MLCLHLVCFLERVEGLHGSDLEAGKHTRQGTSIPSQIHLLFLRDGWMTSMSLRKTEVKSEGMTVQQSMDEPDFEVEKHGLHHAEGVDSETSFSGSA